MVIGAERQQHKAEFTSLREIQAGADRHSGRSAKDPRQHRHNRALGHHRGGRQQQHQPPFVDHHPPVELHADGDEEQAEQHIVKGSDVAFHLMLELGLGDQHAGDESTKGEGQAGVFGQPGQPQGDQQHVEDEQLFSLSSRDLSQPPAHRLLPA